MYAFFVIHAILYGVSILSTSKQRVTFIALCKLFATNHFLLKIFNENRKNRLCRSSKSLISVVEEEFGDSKYKGSVQ